MLEAPSLQNDETPVSATFVLGFSFMICSLRLSKLGFKLTIELRVTVTFWPSYIYFPSAGIRQLYATAGLKHPLQKIYFCVCMCEMCMCMGMWRSEGNMGILFYHSLPHSLETSKWTQSLAGGQPRIFLSPYQSPTAPRLEVHTTTPDFYMGSRDLNSGLPACTAKHS